MKRIIFPLLLASTMAFADAPTIKPSIYVNDVVIEADMDKTNPEEVQYYVDAGKESTALVRKLFKDEGYAVDDSPKDNNQVSIKTTALFNPGNKAVRWIGGLFGAGKASATVTMEAFDASGAALSNKKADGTMRMGAFGGDAKHFLLGVIDSAWNMVMYDIPPHK